MVDRMGCSRDQPLTRGITLDDGGGRGSGLGQATTGNVMEQENEILSVENETRCGHTAL